MIIKVVETAPYVMAFIIHSFGPLDEHISGPYIQVAYAGVLV